MKSTGSLKAAARKAGSEPKNSILKMCYAANTKGTTALLCGILATAEVLGMIYQRIAGFKDVSETPALEEVLEKLAHPPGKW